MKITIAEAKKRLNSQISVYNEWELFSNEIHSKLTKKNLFLYNQIYEAEKRGKKSFDPERFLKTKTPR